MLENLELTVRLVHVVRAAAERHPLGRRNSTEGERLEVVQFEEACLHASTFGASERATAFVARPHRAPHFSGHVTRARA